MYSVIDVAKYIILYCKRKGYSISNLKLQKLLYFVQAQFLVTYGFPAFDEEIEAWDFGPVVPEAYHYFKMWGSSEIPFMVAKGAERRIRVNHQNTMNDVLDQCAHFSAPYLVKLTHNQSPWEDTYDGSYNKVIPKSAIRRFFE